MFAWVLKPKKRIFFSAFAFSAHYFISSESSEGSFTPCMK
jgi:hypothetical protein